MVKVFVKIGIHKEELPAFITTLGHYKLVLRIPWMRDHDVKLDFAENSLEFTADKCHTTCMNPSTKVYSELPKYPDDPIQISMISATSYHRMTRKKNHQNHYTFAMSLYDIHQALQDSETDEQAMRNTVPPEYHKFLALFRKVNTDQLPPQSPYDYQIELQEGFKSPFGPLYSLS